MTVESALDAAFELDPDLAIELEATRTRAGSPSSTSGPGRTGLLSRPAVRGWLLAAAVYVTAVFHRSSLGVAGLDAADRFGISAGQLSVFVLLQLGVYAGMQVPTGVLVDRFGPRRLLLAAASTMAAAQLLFALAPNYPSALLARALLGCGDALTFVSVLRFAALHFSPRRYPMIVAVTGTLGSVGNVAATVPLSAALDSLGWAPSFALASCASVVVAAAVWCLLPGLPDAARTARARRTPRELRESLQRVADNVAGAWSTPGTRAGFWVHFATMSFTTMFGVLWGVPYLVAQGFSRGAASGVLMASVAATVVASPVIGAVFGRHRAARVPFALFMGFGTASLWAVLLGGFGGRPPHALLVVAVAFTAIGSPASGIGFALARDYNRPALVGTASGVVNVGGFTAAIVASLAVGRVLDMAGGDGAGEFRAAFLAALAVELFGSLQMVRWYRRLRADVLSAQDRGEPVPVPAVRRRWDLVTA